MQIEAVSPGAGLVGQLDIGEQFVAPPPHAPQALEHRAVVEPGRTQPLVGPVDRDGHAARGRPGGEVRRSGSGACRWVDEGTSGVPGPRLVVGRALGACMDRHRPGPADVGCAHGDLHQDAARVRQ